VTLFTLAPQSKAARQTERNRERRATTIFTEQNRQTGKELEIGIRLENRVRGNSGDHPSQQRQLTPSHEVT
jgi:hypothetical protein